VQELLLEGPSKTDPDRMSGRTRGNRLVHVERTAATQPGTLVNAMITEAASFYLLGAVTSAPAQAAVGGPLPAVAR